jgi:hypothetical protein
VLGSQRQDESYDKEEHESSNNSAVVHCHDTIETSFKGDGLVSSDKASEPGCVCEECMESGYEALLR